MTRLAVRSVALALLLLVVGPVGASAAGGDSAGTDFWLAFPGNLPTAPPAPELSVMITGSVPANGTLSVPGLSHNAPFTVTPGAVTTVPVPDGAELNTSDAVVSRGVHVTANAEVTVTGFSSNAANMTTTPDSADTFLAHPTDTFGTDHWVLGYENNANAGATQLAVVAPQDGTVVTITPSVATNGHPQGTPYNVNLAQGQAYLLRNGTTAGGDLSGTRVQASKPVAVLGGQQCAQIPSNQFPCDYVVEELPPVSAWGRHVVAVPLAGREGGDVLRIMAAADGTTINWGPSTPPGAPGMLNRGNWVQISGVTARYDIRASGPILVAQYATSGGTQPNNTFFGDPLEMLVPHVEQFETTHVLTSPSSGFTQNYLNVVAPSAAVGSLSLDGAGVDPGAFAAVGTSGYSAARLPVSAGAHRLTGARPFGVQVYGFATGVGYGHVGGTLLGSVAQLSAVALAPQSASATIGAQHCVVTTATDGGGAALAGIGVYFEVTGANATTGFGATDQNGAAQLCYSGGNAGADTITATAASGPTATASVNWSAPAGPDPSGGAPAGSSPTGAGVSVPAGPAQSNGPQPTNGNDTLTGTAGDDVICGLLGDDTINGLGGNDTLFGDACNVKARSVFAAAAGGNDTLNGNDGNDKLYGAGGKDKLNGGKGNDKLFGGGGNDKLNGGAGTNGYSGGSGNDVISARNGKKESVDCGAGKKDSATVDKKDKTKRCEKVRRARK